MRRTIFAPEHEDFRESVRGFLRKEAVPKTEEWEAAGVIDRGFGRELIQPPVGSTGTYSSALRSHPPRSAAAA